MKVWDVLTNLWRAPRAAVQESNGGRSLTTSKEIADAIQQAMGLGAGISRASATRNAYYAGCLRLICDLTSTNPFHVKKRVKGGRELLYDHPVSKLFRDRPNRITRSPVAFRRMITAHKISEGNFYALIVRSPVSKAIIELLPFANPMAMDVKVSREGVLSYEYHGREGVRVYPQQDIFHVMGPTLDGLKGLSVLSMARESVEENIRARDLGTAQFKNGLRTPGTMQHPGELGNEAKANIRDSVEDHLPGGKLEDRVMILEEGMKFVPWAINPVDAQWVEARKLSGVEIAMHFGVPLFMLGNTGDTTGWGTGIAEQALGFVNNVLAGHIQDITDAVDTQLIADGSGQTYSDIDLNGLLKADYEKRMRGYAVGRQWGWLSTNDVRRFEDMDEVEGGDDDYLTPTTHIAGDPPQTSPAQNPAR